ncbi:MAG: AAA family ATPase, partial [Endomicrobiia bacterium]|nr:AAA family ATPase [Endomicrobiia bacterium]
RFDELSTGTKQRLAMAKSLLNEPDILLLDEPTIGLDPDIAHKIRALIKKIHAETTMTIILTTHYMKEAEELAGRIAFIKNGSVTALGTSEQLREITRQQDLEGVFMELASDGKSNYETP